MIGNKIGKMLRQTGTGIKSIGKGFAYVGKDIKKQYDELKLGLRGIDTSQNHIIAQHVRAHREGS